MVVSYLKLQKSQHPLLTRFSLFIVAASSGAQDITTIASTSGGAAPLDVTISNTSGGGAAPD